MESEGKTDNVAVSEQAKFLLEQDPNHKWTFKFLKNFTCKASDSQITSYLIQRKGKKIVLEEGINEECHHHWDL